MMHEDQIFGDGIIIYRLWWNWSQKGFVKNLLRFLTENYEDWWKSELSSRNFYYIGFLDIRIILKLKRNNKR